MSTTEDTSGGNFRGVEVCMRKAGVINVKMSHMNTIRHRCKSERGCHKQLSEAKAGIQWK